MSLGAHLVELRRRLFIAALAVLAGMVFGYILSDWVLGALRAPITELAAAQGRDASLNFTDVSAAFDLRLQISFTVGLVVSSPIWLYEIWAFVMPGLKRHEKRYAVGFVLTAVPLFLAGCAAGWFVLPHMVSLLTGFAPEGSTSVLNARDYIDFVLKLMVAIGIGFVLPVFLVLLNFAGVVSAASILKSWRWAVLAITLFTAIATPAADIVSMFLLAIPMVLLFFGAAFIAWLHDRRVRRTQQQFDLELPAT
ncbi:twin-arginine translocase subunit TatC [Humibacter sp. BT305]|uniref:Sec-independent protein translocase protein TatC n=1 Tax=Cnuibacter physcomitrellae TaxID=1619308 RepID=A0A1X9LJI3_9MICO|nr:twin-arginine translocase subunit TatC [Cnuibacter physcomitrellae]ARJ05307.1 twin arginine-targeting protein translocase TatC [Cnuibacter physcomitrellae]AXH37320.1 twin-arginine translocase subunit TatC [Humibacter sp. BT305]MCS5497007.1 twin-arginine translocase subunit TatC [Cnuibacter physcomitrellae]GGI35417.1 Sec-independent protein translocase protein TatC [Cnuibacter physcomitrellae]